MIPQQAALRSWPRDSPCVAWSRTMLFHPLPAPSDEDVARLARAVCRKVTRYLRQLTGEDKDEQPTLDHLANASVQGLVATGPRRGCRVLRLGGTGEDAEAAIIGKRCAEVAGSSLWSVSASTLRSAGGGPTQSRPWGSPTSSSQKAAKPGAAKTAARAARSTDRPPTVAASVLGRTSERTEAAAGLAVACGRGKLAARGRRAGTARVTVVKLAAGRVTLVVGAKVPAAVGCSRARWGAGPRAVGRQASGAGHVGRTGGGRAVAVAGAVDPGASAGQAQAQVAAGAAAGAGRAAAGRRGIAPRAPCQQRAHPLVGGVAAGIGRVTTAPGHTPSTSEASLEPPADGSRDRR